MFKSDGGQAERRLQAGESVERLECYVRVGGRVKASIRVGDRAEGPLGVVVVLNVINKLVVLPDKQIGL